MPDECGDVGDAIHILGLGCCGSFMSEKRPVVHGSVYSNDLSDDTTSEADLRDSKICARSNGV